MGELREAALLGIRRANLAASACEDWTAMPSATRVESERGAAEADIYVLVLGSRYGSRVSSEDPRSYTEVEFDAAAAAGIPRLAFIQEPFTVEADGSNADDLAEQVRLRTTFATRVATSSELTLKYFRTAEELRHELTLALLKLEPPQPSRVLGSISEGPPAAGAFRAVPEYALLDTDLAGRSVELAQITEWSKSSKPVLVLEAFGGFGKSALSWWWWEVQRSSDDWDGGFWFSFYEPGATQAAFFRQLHAHLLGTAPHDSPGKTIESLESETLDQLRSRRHLIVLDGFERMLMRAATLDANQEDLEAPTDAEDDGGATNLPGNAIARSPRGIRDPLLAHWLVKIANNAKSRVLITTRYRPRQLETPARAPRRGVASLELKGLSLEEARAFWSLIGLDQDDPGLKRLVTGVHGHPLTLAVMAGNLVASDSRSLTDFFQRHPNFGLFEKDIRSADGRDDVFREVLSHLDEESQALLGTISLYAFPAPLRDLRDLLLGPEGLAADDPQLPEGFLDRSFFAPPFSSVDRFLTSVLELEDRRLISRDAENACDMHPLIRSVVRDRAPQGELDRSSERIVDYYARAPRMESARNLDDLFREIQLVFSAARIERWSVAIQVFAFHVRPALVRFGEHALLTKVVDQFFDVTRSGFNVEVKWKPATSVAEPVGSELAEIEARELDSFLIQTRGFSEDQVFQYKARQDLSMAAGNAHAAIGDYAAARAFYELHRRTCPDPLCATMQEECYRQAGDFAEAFDLLRRGFASMRASEGWRSRPFALRRFADNLFDELIERGRPTEARLALAQELRIVQLWSRAALGSQTVPEWLRAQNLKRATIARDEGDLATGLCTCRDVVAHADREGHQNDRRKALRGLGRILFENGAFEEAFSIYDDLVSVQNDGTGQRGLLDRAMRGRVRSGLGDFAEADQELEYVFAQAEDAFATRATVLIYQAELRRAQGDRPGEIVLLNRALQYYGGKPGTPIDMWGVRTALRRLPAINTSRPNQYRFAVLPEWPADAVYGVGAWKVDASDAAFSLKAVWDVPRRGLPDV